MKSELKVGQKVRVINEILVEDEDEISSDGWSIGDVGVIYSVYDPYNVYNVCVKKDDDNFLNFMTEELELIEAE